MKNTNYRFLVWFSVVSVVVFAVAVGLRGWKAGVDSDGVGAADSAAAGDKVVADASRTYAITVPSNWYVETSGANAPAELTVYPDYDPANASTSPATCKIEISSFAVSAGTDLDGWITNYLHADPTASVGEISRTSVTVGGAPTDDGATIGNPVSGIEWRGTLNNMTTTLVYAEAPSGKNFFEIAPSTLSEASDADNDDCDLDLRALVANFHIENDEP